MVSSGVKYSGVVYLSGSTCDQWLRNNNHVNIVFRIVRLKNIPGT